MSRGVTTISKISRFFFQLCKYVLRGVLKEAEVYEEHKTLDPFDIQVNYGSFESDFEMTKITYENKHHPHISPYNHFKSL